MLKKEKNNYIVNQSTSEVYMNFINIILFCIDDYSMKAYYVV